MGNWGYETTDLTCLGGESFTSKGREGYRVGYRAIVEVWVRAEDGTVTFSDVGFGDGMEYGGNTIKPHELASKEAVTDGIKRCLKNFGDQFGLCLYEKSAPEHEGKWRDIVGDLKSRVQSLALSYGASSAEDVTQLFEVEMDDLQNPDKLREILASH